MVNTRLIERAALGKEVSYDGVGRCSIAGRKFHFALPSSASAIYNYAFLQEFILFIRGRSRMRILIPRTAATMLALLLAPGVASAATTTKHSSSSHSSASSSSSHHSSSYKKTSEHSSKHSSQKKTATAKSHGQRTIGEDRTREIQEALIREHYLAGEPSGTWDNESKEAMIRFQEDNGWQTKVTPDSRALIKLGLGPDHKNLLNPDTADIASPHELGLPHATLPGGAAQQ